MINNRQGGGRRRGRGGQRGQSLGGQPGNRQDNRQRGNAAQLLEKYKNMARDSQLAGDRVQTEYYLQYADHYFRVLSESRARFEDQRRQRGEDLDDEEEGDEEMVDAGEEQASGDEDRPRDRGDRYSRRDRGDRGERGERRPRRAEERSTDDGDEDDREERGHRSARGNGGDSIPFDALPPAIGRDEPEAEETAEEGPRRPRRRTTRAPRAAEGDGEVAPAA